MIVTERILLSREGWERLNEELRRCRMALDSRLSSYVDALQGSEPGDAAIVHEQQEIAATKSRMAHLERILSRAVPIGPEDRTPGVVGVGSSVTVRWEDGDEETYLVVGPPEVEPGGHRISYESPVGRSLMGRRQDEWVEAATPGGTCRMKIVAVR